MNKDTLWRVIAGVTVVGFLVTWWWIWGCCLRPPNVLGDYTGTASATRTTCALEEETTGFAASLAISPEPVSSAPRISGTLYNTLQRGTVGFDVDDLTVSGTGHLSGSVAYRFCHDTGASDSCTSGMTDEGGQGFLLGAYADDMIALKLSLDETNPERGCSFHLSVLAKRGG